MGLWYNPIDLKNAKKKHYFWVSLAIVAQNWASQSFLRKSKPRHYRNKNNDKPILRKNVNTQMDR